MIIFDPRIIVPWVSSRCECSAPATGVTAIGLVRRGRIVAGVVYERFNGRSIFVSLAIDRGCYLDREFLWVISDYPFNQLGVEQVIASLNSANERSVKMTEHFGFKFKAVLPNVYDDGDMLLATLVRADCKWLERDYGKQAKNA